MDDVFGALVAQSSARDGAAIAGAVVLLAACTHTAYATPARAPAAGGGRRRVDVLFASSCALFAGSLAARALLVPFVIMAATTLVFARAERRVVRVAVAVAATTVAAAIGAAAGSAAARGGRPAPSTEVAAGAELEQMARFEAQKNLFRARWAARAWATREGTDPGDGFLALARLDHALGDDERARKALAKIDARATSPRVREEAAKLRTAWGAPP